MKIAWFTPFSANSAIGRSGRGVVEALAGLASVDLFCFDKDALHATSIPVRRFASHRDISPATLAEYDFAVYNFGNYLPYHLDLFEVSRRTPGICVLHDFVLHHFFAAYYLEHHRQSGEYVAAMERLYGAPGKAAALASIAPRGQRVWESDQSVDFPFFEEVITGARGVITHSEFFRSRVERVWAGPLRRLPLPYAVERHDDKTLPRDRLGVEPGRLVILTIGHVNPNKRVNAVIEALGRVRASVPAFQYVIAGPCPDAYRLDLEALARKSGVADAVTFAGRVSDQALHSLLEHADVCVNLRYPVIEGASASVIEEMLYAKPVIVSDVGFYAELPTDAVRKVDPHSVDHLAAALRDLLGDPAPRTAMGARAHEFAAEEFRSDRYAAQLLEFAKEIRRAQPILAVTDRLAAECARIGVTSSMSVLDGLAATLEELFGNPPPSTSR
ncbi:MAG: glycosyltransferase [Bryobacteraceae bacterium]